MFNWIVGIPLLTLFASAGLAFAVIPSTRGEPSRPILKALLLMISFWAFLSFMAHSVSYPSTGFWLYILFLCAMFTGAISAHFSIQFSRYSGPWTKWIVRLFYALAAVLSGLMLSGHLIKSAILMPDGSLDIQFGAMIPVMWGSVGIALLFAIGLIFLVFVRSSHAERLQAFYLILGFIIICLGVLSNIFISSYPVDIAANFLFVSFLSYGIIGRHVLRPAISLPWPKTMLVTTFLLALIYIATLIFFRNQLDYSLVRASITAGSIAAIFGIIMFGPTRELLLGILESWLFPNVHRYQRALSKLAKVEYSLSKWDDNIGSILNIITEATRARGTVMLLRNECGREFEAKYYSGNDIANMLQIRLPFDSPLVTYLNENDVTSSSEELKRDLNMRVMVRGEDNILNEIDSTIYCAIRNKNRPIAILAVTRHPYKGWDEDEVRDFLKLVCNHIATNAINAELYRASQREITMRKRAEEQVKELYNQEKALRQQLEAEMKKRIDFSRALVHELKTPLTPVIASIDTLADGLTEEPWISLARNIERGAEKLGERVDELLDIARSEAGVLRVDLKRINPLKLFRRVADEMNELALRQNQSLTTDLPPSLPVIMADESRLRQVLQNLINNAFKYTPEGTKIVLSARAEDECLIVQVQDTGPGMPKEMQDRIFDIYSRGEDDRARLSGLGIGLALCKNIVEMHGGEIWLKSEKGKGATFSFSLPTKQD